MSTDPDFLGLIYDLLERYGDVSMRAKAGHYNFVSESSLDSFALLSFIADVEDRFAVQFNPDELAKSDTHTVGGLVRLILDKREKT